MGRASAGNSFQAWKAAAQTAPRNLAIERTQFPQPAGGIAIDHLVDGMFEGELGAVVFDQPVDQRHFRPIISESCAGLFIDLDIAEQHAPGIGRGRARPHPVIAEHGIDIAGPAAQQHQPHPQVEILGLGHAFIKAADCIEIGAAKGGADIDVETAVEHIGEAAVQAIAGTLLAIDASALAADRAEHPRVAGGKAQVRVSLQHIAHGGQIVRPEQVVAIEQGNQRCPGFANRAVARGGDPVIRRVEKADAGIGKKRRYGARDIIWGAIVDNQAFPVGHGLGQQRIKRLADQMCHAIGRHDHRNPRKTAGFSGQEGARIAGCHDHRGGIARCGKDLFTTTRQAQVRLVRQLRSTANPQNSANVKLLCKKPLTDSQVAHIGPSTATERLSNGAKPEWSPTHSGSSPPV